MTRYNTADRWPVIFSTTSSRLVEGESKRLLLGDVVRGGYCVNPDGKCTGMSPFVVVRVGTGLAAFCPDAPPVDIRAGHVGRQIKDRGVLRLGGNRPGCRWRGKGQVQGFCRDPSS